MLRLLAAAAALCFVAACGAPDVSGAAAVGSATTTVAAPASPVSLAGTHDAPAFLTFGAVGVSASLHPTGLNKDGTVKVPALDKASEVDYVNWGNEFGKDRPVVVVSHVNGRSAAGKVIPGGFLKLAQAKVGDMLTLQVASGAKTQYRVASVKTVLKSSFPSSIYDPQPVPTLVAITCGGVLNTAEHSFESNVIVRATQV
jgi:Sortase domain